MLLHTYDQFESAAVFYERAGLLERDFRWPYLRALTLADMGDTEGALAGLAEALAINPDYVRARIRSAELLLAAGRLEEAGVALDGLDESMSNRPEPAFLRGQLALRTGDAEAAIAAFESVRAVSGDFTALHHALAQAHRISGDVEAVQRHTDLAERSRDARANVADPVMARVLALNISATARIERARRLAMRGDNAGALQVLERALADSPDLLEVHVTLAGLFAGQRAFDRADEHLAKAKAIDPSHPNVYYSTGIARLAEERLVEAEEAFRRTLELDPRDANAWTQLGLVHEMRGRDDEAERYFTRALEEDPWHRQGSWMLGRHLLGKGQAGAAIEHLAPLRALRDPSSGAILLDLGRAYLELGRKQEAASALREAVEASRAFGDSAAGSSAGSLLLRVERELAAAD